MPVQIEHYERGIVSPRRVPGGGWLPRPALLALMLTVIPCFSRCALGSEAQLSASPASINFGNDPAGVSVTSSVTLTNSGDASAQVSQARVQGSGFSITGLTLPLTLGVDGSTIFTVKFHPEVTGSVTGSVTLSCASGCSTLTIPLWGTGITPVPALTFSTSSLAFGSQTVGTSSAAKTITLKDTGYASLEFSSIALSGTNPNEFVESNNCGSNIVVAARCTISVTFTPTAVGSFSAIVSINDNVLGSPQLVSLSGTGTGGSSNESASPVASLSPTSLSFGDQGIDVASSSQVVTLSNTGGAALSVSGIALTGTDPDDFTENNTCGSSVAAGGSCTIVCMFTPSASGSLTASLSVSDNASGSPQTVALSGTGVHDVILSWSASSGAAGYDVYRGTTSGGESSTHINSALVIGATYVDTDVQAGQTYYYKVTAVGSSGTQSAESSEASATVP